MQVQSQIYQELGLTGATTSASTENVSLIDALDSALQAFGSETSSSSFSFAALSTEAANLFATISADATAFSGDVSTWITDAFTAF